MEYIAGRTVIKPCDCKSDYQDKRYGENRRVHNVCDGGNYGSKLAPQIRCTVCAKEKQQ